MQVFPAGGGMKAFVGTAVGLLAAALCGGAHAQSASFRDWTAVCDNTRTCSAYGFSPEAVDHLGYLTIKRTGAGAAAPQVSVTAYSEGKGTWRLSVDGRRIAEVTPVGAPEADPATATLSPAQASAVLAAIRNGRRLTVAPASGAATDISLAGSAAALRWIDDRQKRAGTTTALVARGRRPVSAVSAPPPPPYVKAAAPVSQTGAPTQMPASAKALLSGCDDDIDSLGIEPMVARLSPGVMLWGPACSRGAYNIIYSFILTDERGGNVRRAAIPYADGKTTDTLMNADFDPATQTLSNFDKGRGLGDCGAETSWVWDGFGFRLSEQTIMPECRGVLPGDWPTSFVSRPR